MPRVPAFTQVFPLRIHDHNQRHLLDPQQSLDLFLAGNRRVDITETLEIDKAVDLVVSSEFAFDALLVLEMRVFRDSPLHLCTAFLTDSS